MKDNVKRMRRQSKDWKKMFIKFIRDTFDNGLLPKIYKELLKLSNKKTNSVIKTWAKNLKKTLTKEDIHNASKHIKRCSTLHIIE